MLNKLLSFFKTFKKTKTLSPITISVLQTLDKPLFFIECMGQETRPLMYFLNREKSHIYQEQVLFALHFFSSFGLHRLGFLHKSNAQNHMVLQVSCYGTPVDLEITLKEQNFSFPALWISHQEQKEWVFQKIPSQIFFSIRLKKEKNSLQFLVKIVKEQENS